MIALASPDPLSPFEDNDELVIKNYAYLFNTFSPFLLFFGFVIPIGIIYKYLKVLALGEGDVSVTFYISILLLIYMIKMLVKRLNSFKIKPPIFVVTKDNIIIDEFIDNYKFRHVVKKNINTISNVKFILNSEVQSYGRINKTSLIKRFFKGDIIDGFIELIAYCIIFFSFLFFYLPIKILILLRHREPLYLLRKNFLIEFDDKSACVINIYSKSYYEQIIHILEENNITVDKKIKLSILLKKEK